MVFDYGQMSEWEPPKGWRWDIAYVIVGVILMVIGVWLVLFALPNYEPPVRNVPTESYVGTFSLLGEQVDTLEEDDTGWNWLFMGNQCGMVSTGKVFCARI
jgi:hypothetical protein